MSFRVEMPQAISIKEPRTQKTFPVGPATWLFEVIDDNKMGITARDLFLREKLENKIEKSVDDHGGTLVLTNDEYEKLSHVVDSPTGGYNTKIAKQLLPYIKAVLIKAEKVQ